MSHVINQDVKRPSATSLLFADALLCRIRDEGWWLYDDGGSPVSYRDVLFLLAHSLDAQDDMRSTDG